MARVWLVPISFRSFFELKWPRPTGQMIGSVLGFAFVDLSKKRAVHPASGWNIMKLKCIKRMLTFFYNKIETDKDDHFQCFQQDLQLDTAEVPPRCFWLNFGRPRWTLKALEKRKDSDPSIGSVGWFGAWLVIRWCLVIPALISQVKSLRPLGA